VESEWIDAVLSAHTHVVTHCSDLGWLILGLPIKIRVGSEWIDDAPGHITDYQNKYEKEGSCHC